MDKLTLIITLCLSLSIGKAQDTIYVYELANQFFSAIDPVPYDTNMVFDNTSYSVGKLGNQTPLSLTPPTTNLFPNTDFSYLERAALHYSVSDYPIRTAVSLISYNADTSAGTGCSGIMVAPDMVLTAAHCVESIQSIGVWLADSILVAPAYDNGQFSPGINTSFCKKYFMFKKTYDNPAISDDIMLLQLREPIGLEVGWIGIAFSSDASYFDNKVFHKLSYPSQTDYFDTTKDYNGDSLYYQYGEVDFFNPISYLGVSGAWGIPGQSGSSLFYTDNQKYYTFGVLSVSSNIRHATINRQMFYQLANIINNYSAYNSIDKIKETNKLAKVYPNPFVDLATIVFENPKYQPYQLKIFDMQGKLVRLVSNLSSNKVLINRKNLSKGSYFFQLSAKGEPSFVGKLQIGD